MSTRSTFDQESRERAVRMHLDRYGQGDVSMRAARIEVGELLGTYLESSSLRCAAAFKLAALSGAVVSRGRDLVRLRRIRRGVSWFGLFRLAGFRWRGRPLGARRP